MPNTQEARKALHRLNELRRKHMGVHLAYVPAEEKQEMCDLATIVATQLRSTAHDLTPVERFIFLSSQ